jgi:2'-hydroxyisoflavone reductase
VRLLILGGTVFVGRLLVEVALERGHQVTLFNRGQHNPELFPEVEKLRGDRDGDLTALEGREWDAVIDPSGYVPRIVRASAELLASKVRHYTFISTISVYDHPVVPGSDESGRLATIEDESVEEVTGETYGALKVLCEQVVREIYPGNALIVRPGLVAGPHDPTDRFTYWPVRVARGGEVLAPGEPDQPVQFIDVRDLAGWMVEMVEQTRTGTYNATGPDYPLTLERLLETCRNVTGSDASFTWLSESFLLEQGVAPFTDLPLWLPAEAQPMSTTDCRKAIAAGLRFRPLAETVRDTLAWAEERVQPDRSRAGISPERERELLDAWRASESGG